MRHFIHILLVVFVCLALVIIIPPRAQAESRLTITFAGATIIGGVYVFISWTFSSTAVWRPHSSPNVALFNYDSRGWSIECPQLKLIEDNHSYVTPYLDLLKYRF